MADSDSGIEEPVVEAVSATNVKPEVQPPVVVRPPSKLPKRLEEAIYMAPKRARIMVKTVEWKELAEEHLAISNPKLLTVVHKADLGHSVVAWGK